MKKILSVTIIVLIMFLSSSCSSNKRDEETTDTEGTSFYSFEDDESVTESELVTPESVCYYTIPNSTFPSSGSVITTTPEYDVYPVSDEYSFEDIVGVFLEKAGVDDYTLGESYQGNTEYTPVFWPDYSQVIDVNYTDPYYVPHDYELHKTRSFLLQRINVSVCEYEDADWAEIGFWGEILFNESSSSIFINNDYSGGYCFINCDSYFRAIYMMDGSVVIFNYYYRSDGTQERYQIYLDICEELGLPTCDEITEEIMG